ncbi:MAG: fasciclin domain-containing protein [Psychrobium sp.]
MTIKRINTTIVALLFSFVITGCSGDDDKDEPVPQATTIVDVATSNGNFTTLVQALKTAGLDDTLSDTSKKFTVFAPTDDAFALLGTDAINALLADKDQLTSVLTYHVLGGEVKAAAAISSAGSRIDTVNGAKLGLSLDGESLLVNTVTVTSTDIMADNGVIHVIDAVLMPPAAANSPTNNIVETAISAGSFTTLVTALQATGLDDLLSDDSQKFTVFAPTDAAFAMIDAAVLDRLLENPDHLAAILKQHVITSEVDSTLAYSLNGKAATTAATTDDGNVTIPVAIDSTKDTLTFGGATVVTKDIHTSNGIIHVIDMVVIADAAIPPAYGNIAEVAIANGSFKTLVAGLTAADLVTTVSDPDSAFTVFAPTDAAFAKLNLTADNIADLDNLKEILLYHVLTSEVKQDAAVTLAQSNMNTTMSANTAKNKLALSKPADDLYVNNAKVTLANAFADNGVIHVIDTVLLPPADPATSRSDSTIAQLAVANDDLETLVTALTAADLVTALSDENATFTVFAPTDAAFAALPDGVLTGLLADVPALTDVLELHVIKDAEVDSVTAMSLNGKSAATLSGENIAITIKDGALTVGSAKVTVKDVYAKNGVIHIIDAVITQAAQ